MKNLHSKNIFTKSEVIMSGIVDVGSLNVNVRATQERHSPLRVSERSSEQTVQNISTPIITTIFGSLNLLDSNLESVSASSTPIAQEMELDNRASGIAERFFVPGPGDTYDWSKRPPTPFPRGHMYVPREENERPTTPFQEDDIREWQKFVTDLRRIDENQAETFSEIYEDSECPHTPTSEWGTRATEPTKHTFFRRAKSAPALRSYITIDPDIRSDITIEKLNLEFLEIDKKSNEIINLQCEEAFLKKFLCNNDTNETLSDIYFFPDTRTSTRRPPPHRRSYSKLEFTQKESMLRDYLRAQFNNYLEENGKLPDLTEEKMKLQELIKEFLIKASAFIESCENQFERIEHVMGLINEIVLFYDKCFIDSVAFKRSLKMSKPALDKILAGNLQMLRQHDLCETMEESSESDFSEVVVNLGNRESFNNLYSPPMSESSESSNEDSESIADLSTDDDCLDSVNTPGYASDSLDIISKGYLSIIVKETIDSNSIEKIRETKTFLKSLKASNSRKIESGEKGFLDPETLKYIDRAILDLDIAFIDYLFEEAIDSKSIGKICETRAFLKSLIASNGRKIESGEKRFLDPEILKYIDNAILDLNGLLSFTDFDLG